MNIETSEARVRDNEPALPAWATEAYDYWEGREQGYDVPWRIVRRVGRVGPWEVEVNAVQKIDGSLEGYAVELGDLDGRPLDAAPVARIRELATFLTNAAKAIEASGPSCPSEPVNEA